MTEWMLKTLAKRDTELIAGLKVEYPDLPPGLIKSLKKLLSAYLEGLIILKAEYVPGDPVMVQVAPDPIYGMVTELKVLPESVLYMVSFGDTEKLCYSIELASMPVI